MREVNANQKNMDKSNINCKNTLPSDISNIKQEVCTQCAWCSFCGSMVPFIVNLSSPLSLSKA